MKISHIYIGCYARDFWLARLCVASIRHWYPTVPISLIKDLCGGDFNTQQLERDFDVDVANTPPYMRNFGRLEILFRKEAERFLYLDADIVMAGPVLDSLNACEEEFIVHKQPKTSYTPSELKALYYDEEKLRDAFDPEFPVTDFVFNSGQFVATSGRITRDSFVRLIDWESMPPRNRNPSFIALNDQGPLNYALSSLGATEAISLGHCDFQRNGSDERLLSELPPGHLSDGIPCVVHWPGKKPLRICNFNSSHILKFYENIYLQNSSHSRLSYRLIRAVEIARAWLLQVSRRCYSRAPETLKDLFRAFRSRKTGQPVE